MDQRFNFVDLEALGARFPDRAETMIVDSYLSDTPAASLRLFRIYHPLPRHYHRQCDEHLILMSGELDFFIEDEPPRRLKAGQMVSFLRDVIHAVQPAGDAPVIFLSADTPRRAPDDVHFVDDAATQGRRFVSHLKDYSEIVIGSDDGA